MKKRIISLLLAVIMIVGMVPFAAIPAMAEMLAKEETGLVDNPLTEWMANVPDDAYLANLNIPATHDSGTAFMKNGAVASFGGQTQTLPIEAQLNIGIRAFDIRLCTEDNQLILCHGPVDCYDYYWNGKEYEDTSGKLTFKKVAERAAQYLVDHPTETAILFLDNEAGREGIESDDLEEAYEAAERILNKSDHHIIYANPYDLKKWYADNSAYYDLMAGGRLVMEYEVKEKEGSFYELTMGDVRGNLIIENGQIGVYVDSSLNDDYQNAEEKWAVVEPYFNNAKAVNLNEYRNPDLLRNADEVEVELQYCAGFSALSDELQKQFGIVNGRRESDGVYCDIPGHEFVKHPDNLYSVTGETEHEIITGVFTSCHGGGIPDPLNQAEKMTEYLAAYSFKPGYYYGYVIMDDPDRDVIQKIVNTNFPLPDGDYVFYTDAAADGFSAGSLRRLLMNGGALEAGSSADFSTSVFTLNRDKKTGTYTITAKQSQKPLGITDSWGIKLQDEDGSDSQRWTLEDCGDGYIYIRGRSGRVNLIGAAILGRPDDAISTVIGPGKAFRPVRLIDVKDGAYLISSVFDPTKCVEIEGNAAIKNKGDNVQLWTVTNTNDNIFKIEKDNGTGTYVIKEKQSGLLLDISGASAQNGANVLLWSDNAGNQQHWLFEDAGNGIVYIRSMLGTYMTSVDKTDGANVVSSMYIGNETQQFKLTPADMWDDPVNPPDRHFHLGVLQPGMAATQSSAGFKDYYGCSCGKFFEDEACKVEITNLEAWKAQGGNGYLPRLKSNSDPIVISAKAAEANETNPETGAPVMNFGAVAVVLGAAYVLSKKH